jgi:hypothetical protein
MVRQLSITLNCYISLVFSANNYLVRFLEFPFNNRKLFKKMRVTSFHFLKRLLQSMKENFSKSELHGDLLL